MEIDFNQFKNTAIMQVLEDAANISASIGFAMIEPISVLIALNQSHTDELVDYFKLIGVDSNEFYSKAATCIGRYPRESRGVRNLRISSDLNYSLSLAQQIENEVYSPRHPNHPLLTALLMTPGPLKEIAESMGITTAKMQTVLKNGAKPMVIGLANEVHQIKNFITACRKMNERGVQTRLECDTIIIGQSGTGKSYLAEYFTSSLYEGGLIQRTKPIVVDAVNWRIFEQDLGKNLENIADGVLVIDNAQKLLSEDETNNIGNLDSLFSAMDSMEKRPIVILIGLPNGMNQYLIKNSTVIRKFEYVFRLDGYNANELTQICSLSLQNKFGEKIDTPCLTKLLNIFKYNLRNRPEDWAFAHSAVKMADNIFMSFSLRGGESIKPEDISGIEDHEFTVEEIMAKLDDLVGVDSIREEIRNMIAEIEYDRERFGGTPSIRSHFVFTGSPGTGKTTIARIFADILKAMRVLPTGHLIEADRSKLVSAFVGQTAIKTNELIDKAIGGVLFIDEAYSLVADAESNNSFGKEAIDTLLKRLEDDRGKFVCIVAGYTKEMHDFLQSNPGMRSRFNKMIEFKDYTGPELAEIFLRLVGKNMFNLSPDAKSNLLNFFNNIYLSRTQNFGNARVVRNIFDEAKKRQSRRLSLLRQQGNYTMDMAFTLTREDIEGEESLHPMSPEEVIAEMEKDFVGMQNVKNAIRALSTTMAANRRRVEAGLTDPSTLGIHLLLTGNPGTGKTTVARTLGKVLKAIGLLPTDKVIEVDKSMMVGQHVGVTPKKVNDLVDRAMGGILFVDEAYTLSKESSSNNFGREAIETLMKRMEDDRGKFVCILAGYRTLMDEFVRVNPGIDSRITHRIHIEDYTADELFDIFCSMVNKQKMQLDSNARSVVRKAIDEMIATKTKDFGNARAVRNLLDKTLDRQAMRIQTLSESAPLNELTLIKGEDIPLTVHKDIDERECLSRLDSLVGLEGVKHEIRNLAQYLRLEKMRAEALGKPFVGVRDHYLFLGNPGTGKTTVARILGEIFLALGISKNTNFIETDRSALVAGFVGQTSPLANQVIDSALGGILFIDEAYSLNQGPHDSFGHEAIDTLLKRMEDDRGKFVCIAAGYSQEMQQFINSNSGLQSRFNKVIYFEDYSEDELIEIFKRNIAKENFTLAPDAEMAMKELVRKALSRRSRNFGNAREINNLFQKVKEKQSSRIYAIVNAGGRPSDSELLTLTVSDFKL